METAAKSEAFKLTHGFDWWFREVDVNIANQMMTSFLVYHTVRKRRRPESSFWFVFFCTGQRMLITLKRLTTDSEKFIEKSLEKEIC